MRRSCCRRTIATRTIRLRSRTPRVPERRLADDYDPDELLPITLAYAGQVTLLDICLARWWSGLTSYRPRTARSWRSCRREAFRWANIGAFGAIDPAVYAETVHTPWILRLPDGCGASDRSQALVQSQDLAPSLIDWFTLPPPAELGHGHSLLPIVRGEHEGWRNRAFVVGAGQQRGFRTPAWYLRAPGKLALAGSREPARAVELYVKPDDRWEINDVADRCPEVVELLTELLHRSMSAPHGFREFPASRGAASGATVTVGIPRQSPIAPGTYDGTGPARQPFGARGAVAAVRRHSPPFDGGSWDRSKPTAKL